MLLQFAVTNFRSFKDRQVFSMMPSGKIRERVVRLLPTEYPKTKALPTAVVYGPNNAGKSNLFLAIRALKKLVQNSGKHNSGDTLEGHEYFAFDVQNHNMPTTFEIEFIATNDKHYQYSVSFNTEEIVAENLYTFAISEKGKTTRQTLYKRLYQDIQFKNLLKGPKSFHVEKNQLILSRGDNEGNEELKMVYKFFFRHLNSFDSSDVTYSSMTLKDYPDVFSRDTHKFLHSKIQAILKELNTGIEGLTIENIHGQPILHSKHKLFDGSKENGETRLDFKEQSTGTKKLLTLLALALISLEYKRTFCFDELSTGMHPEITAWLVEVFNDPETNPNGSQLILSTHDISLIDRQLFERDQIYVAEKDSYGATSLYSFADINGLRPQHKLSAYYESGQLGGVPRFSHPYLKHLITESLHEQKENRATT